MVNDLFPQAPHILPDRLGNRARNVILVSEIQLRFDHRPRMGQPLRPGVVEPRKAAGCLFRRKPPLHFRLGGNQIGKAFHGDEVHLAVEKGTAREFPRLCRPQARQRGQGLLHRLHRRAAAMDL